MNILQKQNIQGEECKLNLIYLIMKAKSDLKNAIGVDTSKFPKKVNSANLKSDLGKLDINKPKNVPINLSNLIKSR